MKRSIRDWAGLSSERATAITCLPERFGLGNLRRSGFLLHHEQRKSRTLEIYYAPLDYLNLAAKVVIVGITPGWRQTEIAFRTAREALLMGRPASEACQRASRAASFAGPLRANLIGMLDGIGLPEILRIDSTAALFEKAGGGLLATTSAITCPVFVGGMNYTGHTPRLIETPILREFLETVMADQLRQVPDAVIVPLGKAVSEALQLLIDLGQLDARRSLLGFPHPSGQNGHRILEYRRHQKRMKRTALAWSCLASSFFP